MPKFKVEVVQTGHRVYEVEAETVSEIHDQHEDEGFAPESWGEPVSETDNEEIYSVRKLD